MGLLKRLFGGGSGTDANHAGPVIHLSPATATEMKMLAVQERLSPDWALRVGIQRVAGAPHGWIYFQDMVEDPPKPGDAVFVSAGIKIYVDATSQPYLQGTTINFVVTQEGKGFTFDNPNVKRV